MNNDSMKVQATIDLPSAKKVDEQIRALEKSISKLKISGQFDDTALKNLTKQLNTLKVNIGTANFSPTALKELTSQVEKALNNTKTNIKLTETENSMRNLNKFGSLLKDQMSQAAQSFSQFLSIGSAVKNFA